MYNAYIYIHTQYYSDPALVCSQGDIEEGTEEGGEEDFVYVIGRNCFLFVS